MAKPNTRPVKVGRFYLTSHAQNRIVTRDLTADCVVKNLCRKPESISPVVVDKKGPSYNRMNRETTASIDPENKNVATIRRLKTAEAKKYGIKKVELERESERVARLAKEKAASKKTTKRTSDVKNKPRTKAAQKSTKTVKKR